MDLNSTVVVAQLNEQGQVPGRPTDEEASNNGGSNDKPIIDGKYVIGTNHPRPATPPTEVTSSEPPPKRTIEPLEIDMGNNNNDDPDDDRHHDHVEIGLNESRDDDMEQLLPASSPSKNTTERKRKHKTYCFGKIQPTPVGNMNILFPDKFQKSGWGVMGPQWFGPLTVWGILVVSTHFCIRASVKHLGIGSVAACVVFLTFCTIRLLDVSLRDPGICLSKEIPENTPVDQLSQWRWCDFCRVYQSPDGSHCPDCNVCIAGYDHHCVWMGTCIGKRNYKQFVNFNLSWLYYVAFAIFWIGCFGPLVYHTLDD
jgi:hypothetical protein